MEKQSLGEAVLKIETDTSEFEAALQRCIDLVVELNKELDKTNQKVDALNGKLKEEESATG